MLCYDFCTYYHRIFGSKGNSYVLTQCEEKVKAVCVMCFLQSVRLQQEKVEKTVKREREDSDDDDDEDVPLSARCAAYIYFGQNISKKYNIKIIFYIFQRRNQEYKTVQSCCF